MFDRVGVACVRQRKVKADKSWIGATPEGKKELVGLTDGVRESTRSWNELLLDLRRRGLYRWGPSSRLPMARSASGQRMRDCRSILAQNAPASRLGIPLECKTMAA